jgi:cobalt-zinc-cadmium efflux system membrane fusion protein
MTKINIFNIILLSFVIVFASCSNSNESIENTSEEMTNLIEITQEQIDANNMKFGKPSLQSFNEIVNCNGHISSAPDGMAVVNTQISGIVKTINYSIGDYVKKGETICMLLSNEFIFLQQEFVEVSVLTKKLKSDYERIKTLADENIGSKKTLISIKSEFDVMRSKYQSLKLRLEILGLDVKKIEAGDLYSVLALKAPIGGFITERNIVLGQFVSLQQNVFEIVNIDKLQLQLSVFETDIYLLQEGQKIEFQLLGEDKMIHSAILKTVGKSIDNTSKTINCIAKITDENKNTFINQTYIEAEIIVKQSQSMALPNNAIQKSEDEYYVFVLEKMENETYFLQKTEVEVGRISNGFTEIIGGNNLKEVIVEGGYNLQVN